MPANYVLLSEVTLAANAASVTMANIPQTGYTDLKIVSSTRTDRASQVADWVKISFNGSTSSFSLRELEGDGTTAASYTGTTGLAFFATASTATANTFGNSEVYIPNYTSSNYKSYSADTVTENNATSANAAINAGLWSNTAAITSISFTPNLGTNFVANSTFYLYGLATVGTTPVIAPFASGGDVITNDGTYWIHTFLSSGTFTPAKTLTCDYLVVAGGGGGGSNRGGGGGAGGLRSTVTATGGGGSLESALSLTGGTLYTVTIGAGGAGATNSGVGTSGSNSVFSTITSTGGGGGGFQTTAGITGGSGGGGGGNGLPGSSQPSSSSGSGTTNQGFAGGTGANSGGGGGGASAVGSNVSSLTTQVGANGGAGLAVAITGTSVTYAGGGGGAGETGGGSTTGGGGAGGNNSAGTSGTANLGGGGGAGADTGALNGGAGGSGIVIVRYPIA